ncbi:hypothetical protein HanPSC8_Chr13g0554221 [Helianthus annuus]|nr:hypothetical protein HanPSC8_Chr13g0554221 [Helianthus annuus]
MELGEQAYVVTSSSADFMAMGIQTRKIPAMAMAVLRFQCRGRQLGPPVIVQTLVRKSPWPWSPPPPIFAPWNRLTDKGGKLFS